MSLNSSRIKPASFSSVNSQLAQITPDKINIIKDGLIAWIEPFNKKNTDSDKATITDWSGNGNHATLTNFGWTAASGYVGNNVVPDGVDDEIAVPISSYLEAGDSFSLEFVLEILAEGTTFTSLLHQRESPQRFLGMRNAYNTFGTINGLALLGASDFEVPSTPSMYTSEIGKHDIVFTFSTSEMKIYYKGALVRNVVAAKTLNFGTPVLSAASAGTGSKKIKAFMAYNRDLTADEVAHNYETNKTRFNIT